MMVRHISSVVINRLLSVFGVVVGATDSVTEPFYGR